MSARRLRLASLGLLVFVPQAFAATFTVGSDPACTHHSIQAAIDAASADPAWDTIHVARNQVHAAQALSITANQILDIRGGFADCSATAPSEGPTVIDGSGNGGNRVLTINTGGGGYFELHDLELRGGAAATGAGIRLRSAQLRLAGVVVRDNHASGNGGGIALDSNASFNARLVTLASTLGPTRIVDNSAGGDGGGIHCTGLLSTRSRIDLDRARVGGNSATNGGGLFLAEGCEAYLRSGGESHGVALGVRDNEAALDGGGIAILTAARLWAEREPGLTATPTIEGNTAGRDGGGLFVFGTAGRDHNFVRADRLRIAYNSAGASVAGRGGGLYLGTRAYATLREHPANRACDDGGACVEFVGNGVGGPGRAGQGGAAYVDDRSGFIVRYARIVGNQATSNGSALFIRGNGVLGANGQARIEQALLAGHGGGANYAIVVQNAGDLHLIGSTLANDASATALVRVDATSLFKPDSSILYAPGRGAVSAATGAQLQPRCVLAHENFHAWGVAVGDPLFRDAAGGDLRLQQASPAIDACNGDVLFDRHDLAGTMRGIDLAEVENVDGPYDLGAFEYLPPDALDDLLFFDGFEP